MIDFAENNFEPSGNIKNLQRMHDRPYIVKKAKIKNMSDEISLKVCHSSISQVFRRKKNRKGNLFKSIRKYLASEFSALRKKKSAK